MTVSTERTPSAEPEPYCKVARVDPVRKDVDFDGSNSAEGQELQVVTATHKSEEPIEDEIERLGAETRTRKVKLEHEYTTRSTHESRPMLT